MENSKIDPADLVYLVMPLTERMRDSDWYTQTVLFHMVAAYRASTGDDLCVNDFQKCDFGPVSTSARSMIKKIHEDPTFTPKILADDFPTDLVSTLAPKLLKMLPQGGKKNLADLTHDSVWSRAVNQNDLLDLDLFPMTEFDRRCVQLVDEELERSFRQKTQNFEEEEEEELMRSQSIWKSVPCVSVFGFESK